MHYDESVVSPPDFTKLKRLYELLSHGVTFINSDQIRNMQLCDRAVQYCARSISLINEVTREQVAHGKLNVWRDWLRITWNSGPIEGLVEDLRETKRQKHIRFKEVWEMWQSDTGLTFDQWYQEERMALCKVLKGKLNNVLRRKLEITFGLREIALDYFLPDDNQTLLFDLRKVFCGDDPDLAGFKRVWEFLESEALDEVPHVRISSLIYAALACRANRKQKFPKSLPFNDVDVIAAYLPYCDAMFLDKEMASLLSENPVKTKIGYQTKIFSIRNKDVFLQYLDELEFNAPTGHIQKVREVYGDSWEKPYVEIFHSS